MTFTTQLSARRTRGLPVTGVAIGAFAAMTLAVVVLRPLLPIDETRYLTVAWEMRRDGDWLVPHLNGELYGHKPPFLFWLINLVWSLFGVSEVPARLVAPAFMALAVGLTGRLAREMWPTEEGRSGLAALILATSGMVLVFGTATTFDSMLTAATALGLLALWRLTQAPDARAVVLLGLALGLGTYAKGPVILVHLAPVAVLAPLWTGGAKIGGAGAHLRRLGLALALALLLVGLWLGPALILGGPDYREEVLWRQSAGRMVQAFAHERPFWWYVPLLPLLLWPWGWSAAGLRALAPRAVWSDAGSRLATVQALSTLVLFSLISGKQAHYLLPELPALALLLSRAVPEGWRGWRALAALPALGVALVALAAGTGLVAPTDLGGLSVPVAGLAAGLLLVLGLAWGLLRLGERPVAWALIGPVTVLAFLVVAAPSLWRAQDAGPVGRLLKTREESGAAFVGPNYHGQFTWAGRLSHPLDVLADNAEAQAWAEAHPGGLIVTFRDDLSLPVLSRLPFRSGEAIIHQAPGDLP